MMETVWIEHNGLVLGSWWNITCLCFNPNRPAKNFTCISDEDTRESREFFNVKYEINRYTYISVCIFPPHKYGFYRFNFTWNLGIGFKNHYRILVNLKSIYTLVTIRILCFLIKTTLYSRLIDLIFCQSNCLVTQDHVENFIGFRKVGHFFFCFSQQNDRTTVNTVKLLWRIY